jgi:TolB-like protein
MLACAEQDISRYFIASLFGSKDELPPSISLEGWTDSQTVFLEKVYIEGQVIDKNQIESLSINGNPILQEKGCYIFFSHFANLNEGENILTIKAADQAGNSAIKKITIIRKVPKALQLSERLSLSVFPFDQGGLDSNDSLIFQNNLTDALVNRNRFRVVERQKLDMILEEQKLSRTKLFDKSTALKLGRLAAAQSIITGSIIETRKGIEVVARMIDTETSDILATEDAYCAGRNLFTLKTLAEGMAIKFHRDFPLVNGIVIDRKEKNIFTDLGQEVIKLQRKLIIYREEEKHHPLTGKIIGSDNMIIGRARIVQVMPEMSKAELLEYKVKNVKCLDKVISE